MTQHNLIYRFIQPLLLSCLAYVFLYFPSPLRAQEQLAVYDTASISERSSTIPDALHGISYQITSLPTFDPDAMIQAQANLPTALCAAMTNGFDCARAKEQHLFHQTDNSLSRTGTSLTIPLRSPYAVILTDQKGQGARGWASYFYLEYIPEIKRHHVLVGYYESVDHLLIEAQTGEITVIPYAPMLSPDHKRFVAAGYPFVDTAFTFQIWRVQGNRLNLETDLTIENAYNLQAKRIAWNDATTLEFDFAQPPEDSPITLTVVWKTEQWTVYHDNQPLPTPFLHPTSVGPYNVYGVDTLKVGKRVYYDRDYRFKSIPAELEGQPYLLFANNATRNTDADYVHFTLARPAMVYIAIDDQALHLPGWMAGWQPTPDFLLTDDKINLRLYEKEFAAGQVTLGGNWAEQAAGIRSHYLVVVAPNEQE